METEIFSVIEKFSSLGSIALWGLIALAYKNRLKILKTFLNGNGSSTSKDIEILHTQLTALQENHLHDLSERINKLMEKEEEGNLVSKEILFTLQQMRNELKK